MKKIIVVLAFVMGLGIFTGCGGSSDGGSNADTNTEAEQVNKSVGEICADMIPDPKEFFKKGTMDTMIGESGCSYDLSGSVTKDEYISYVDACKKAGFTRVKLESISDETSCEYYALDESGNYFLTVDYLDIDGDIDIFIGCQEYAKEESGENE